VPSGSLCTLNLAGNNIGAEGAAALAEALKVVNNSFCTVNLAR
jgi:Ran GTPase-activating protein (RanGAP) involved in mRNA processing and transport